MSFTLALFALVIEAVIGYPPALFALIGHPVTWFGRLISVLDQRLNCESDSFVVRRTKGVCALLTLSVIVLAAGEVCQWLAASIAYGWAALAVGASSLLAQRSLHDHVAEVATALRVSLDEGRGAVAKIVGRDVSALDEAGVARAAIESLAENLSDGVVAPALFMAVLGLPGALVYKSVNTADSMIGHKSERYLAFGWAAARADDLLNIVPARVSAGFLALAALSQPGASPGAALVAAWRDASRHASPNAGWPEAAMAGALGLKLGGPRAYGDILIDGAILGDGRREVTAADIERALSIYRIVLFVIFAILAIGALFHAV